MDYLVIYGVAVILLAGCILWNWDVVKLNSHSLHQQWLFWIAVIFPILSCIYFGVIIWQEYTVEISKKGYNDFLDISKLPLYLLAGSPILGAFVASAHRSYQTDIQITTAKNQLTEAKNKNLVDAYISKRKYIYEQISHMKTIDKGVINNPPLLCFDALKIDGYNDNKNDKFINSVNLKLSDLNDILKQLADYKFINPSLFNKKYVELPFGNSVIKHLHPTMELDLIKGKLQNSLHVIFNEDSKISIYKEYCTTVDEIKKHNSKNISIDGEIYSNELEIKIIIKQFTDKLFSVIKDLIYFIYLIFSIIYIEEDIYTLLPNLKISMAIYNEWETCITEMGIYDE